MSEYVVELPESGAADECIRVIGCEKKLYGYELREEIVRCRDCKRFAVDQSDHDYRTGWWCKRWHTDMVKPDGFCAWGETEEGES